MATARSCREMYGTLPITRKRVARAPSHGVPPYRTLRRSGTDVTLWVRQNRTSFRSTVHHDRAKTEGPMKRARKEGPVCAAFPMQP